MPVVAVLGVGATAELTPPTDTVYHNKLLPVAVKALAVAPMQYPTVLVTVGGTGEARMFTSIWTCGVELAHPVIDDIAPTKY